MVLLPREGKNSRLETWRRGCSSFLVSLIMGRPLLSLALALEAAEAVNSGRGASLPSGRAISEESRAQSQSDMHWDPDEQSLHRNGQTLLCAVTARQELKVQSIADGVRSSPQPYTDELVRSEGGLSATGLRQPVAAEKALSICMAAHGRRPSPAGGPLAVRRGLFQLEQSGRGRSEATPRPGMRKRKGEGKGRGREA
jgi:hypothetical protein